MIIRRDAMSSSQYWDLFMKPTQDNIHFIEGEYSLTLVILSVVIAICASYTALFINQRIQLNGFFHKNVWLVLASLAMGLGVWAMHFVGMSAFMLPVNMEYNVALTIVSMIPAIIASFIAFYIANLKKRTIYTYLISGIFMGLGITSMHYIGMYAMKMDTSFYYDPVLFIVSIAIAIVVSFVALYIFSFNKRFMANSLIKWITAILMGSAITSMHYTGMFAMKFYTEGEHVHIEHMHVMNLTPIITTVTVGIAFLFALAGLTNRLDKYVEYRLMNYDPLTQLPNQKLFTEDQIKEKVADSIAIIQIHNFEKIVSAYGYTFGDQIIKNISEIITRLSPEQSRLYRTDSNRFTIVNAEQERRSELIISLERICAIISRPIVIEERSITIDMSVSFSAEDHKQAIHQLFTNAMAVLQSNVISKRYEIIYYDPKIHTFNFERQVTLDIHHAMDNDDVYLVYQPKFNLQEGKLVGLEALIRWKHPIYGPISPATFIPVLEEANKIADLTDWIISKVCQQIQAWTEQGIEFNEVSINIPGNYVTSPRLSQMINENLLKYQVAPRQLELEITETSVINDMDNAIIALNKFREKGLSIALDDFGTGLSSLSYLKRIPLTTIKIDKSFVDDVPLSEKDSAVLQAIVSLGFSLNMKVVIEGVETKQQIDFIHNLTKIPIVQGYYYSKPLTSREFESFVQEGHHILHQTSIQYG